MVSARIHQLLRLIRHLIHRSIELKHGFVVGPLADQIYVLIGGRHGRLLRCRKHCSRLLSTSLCSLVHIMGLKCDSFYRMVDADALI